MVQLGHRIHAVHFLAPPITVIFIRFYFTIVIWCFIGDAIVLYLTQVMVNELRS